MRVRCKIQLSGGYFYNPEGVEAEIAGLLTEQVAQQVTGHVLDASMSDADKAKLKAKGSSAAAVAGKAFQKRALITGAAKAAQKAGQKVFTKTGAKVAAEVGTKVALETGAKVAAKEGAKAASAGSLIGLPVAVAIAAYDAVPVLYKGTVRTAKRAASEGAAAVKDIQTKGAKAGAKHAAEAAAGLGADVGITLTKTGVAALTARELAELIPDRPHKNPRRK